MKIKLPKQWKHWLKLSKLKPESIRTWYSGYYFKGRNRYWRVGCDGSFECSCPLEHFDRWANSRGAENVGIPKTEKEFLETVKYLIDKSKDKK